MPIAPITQYDLPSTASANVIQVSSGTGYCSASDVASLNKLRSAAWGLGNEVTVSDVNGFITMIAGQIDAALTTRGVQVPVNTASFPEAEGLLAGVNAWGAAWMVEEASPTSTNGDRVKAAYDAAMAMVEGAKWTIDVPVDMQRSEVRAPFLTYQPPDGVYDPVFDGVGGHAGDGISAGGGARRALPFFNRGMRF